MKLYEWGPCDRHSPLTRRESLPPIFPPFLLRHSEKSRLPARATILTGAGQDGGLVMDFQESRIVWSNFYSIRCNL